MAAAELDDPILVRAGSELDRMCQDGDRPAFIGIQLILAAPQGNPVSKREAAR